MIEIRVVHTNEQLPEDWSQPEIGAQADLLLGRIRRIDTLGQDSDIGVYTYDIVVARGGKTHGIVSGVIENFKRKKFNIALLLAEILDDMNMEACKLDEALSANLERSFRRAMSKIEADDSGLRYHRPTIRSGQSE